MKTIVTSGKRKSAIARVTVKAGSGNVKVNNTSIDSYQPKLSRLKMQEPIILAGDIASKVDLKVKVVGGGVSSQADASRLAIAKALVAFSKNKSLKEQYLKYDRSLLVADVRRKEPSKPNRRGQARSKRQKSYR